MRSRLLMTVAGLLLLGGSLGGCGLRGDLYLEAEQAQQAKPERRESLREKIGRQTVAEPDPVEFDTAATPTKTGAAGDSATESSDDSESPERPRTGPDITAPETGQDPAPRP